MTVKEDQRQFIGERLAAELAENWLDEPNTVSFDPFDSNNIDALLDTVDKALADFLNSLPKDPMPAIGTVWLHDKTDNHYVVTGHSNQFSDELVKFPPTVIYEDKECRTWSRPLYLWHDSFTQTDATAK